MSFRESILFYSILSIWHSISAAVHTGLPRTRTRAPSATTAFASKQPLILTRWYEPASAFELENGEPRGMKLKSRLLSFSIYKDAI